MPNSCISTITLPSGQTYDIKDAEARQMISDLNNYTAFLGVTTTNLSDNATTNPITIDGQSVTATNGNIVTYGNKEFIFNGTKWQEFGDLSGLKALAFKDQVSASYTPAGSINITATGTKINTSSTFTGTKIYAHNTFSGNELTSTGSYTPAGTVGAPTISVATAGDVANIKNPTSQTVVKTVGTLAPTSAQVVNDVVYCSITGENLSFNHINYTTGASITTSTVEVKTGDASYTASAPSFTGTAATISVKGTPSGTVSTTYNTTSSGASGNFTPAGSISTTYTPQGGTATTNQFQPSILPAATFTGTAATITSS